MQTNKTILITGASSGIGLYCAHQLQNRGYKVIASCRKQADVERLTQQGLTCIQLDLDDSVSIQRAMASCLEISGGSIYGLFNNGAYGQPGAVEDLSRSALRAQFETNLFGWVELTNLLLPVMLRQGDGRIIQNSSVLGLAAMPMRGAYVASKFALEGITDTLRLELRNTGVHISLIEPGPIKSRFRHNALAALKTRVDLHKSRHQSLYKNALTRLEAEESKTPFTQEPEAVYRRLIQALESRHPQRRYYVTFPTYLVAALKRLLPASLLDKLLILLGR